MYTLNIEGSYHAKSIQVFVRRSKIPVNTVTIIVKGLYGVFDKTKDCGVNFLGNKLTDSGISHVVYYNSSRDFLFNNNTPYSHRQEAFRNKTFSQESEDLRRVINYVSQNSQDLFSVIKNHLIFYIHGNSFGGLLAIMITEKFLNIKKISLCAPAAGRGKSLKPIVTTIPDAQKIFTAIERFKGDIFWLYGDKDTVIPRDASFSLVEHAINAHVKTLVIPGASHDFSELNGRKSKKIMLIFAKETFNFFVNNN